MKSVVVFIGMFFFNFAVLSCRFCKIKLPLKLLDEKLYFLIEEKQRRNLVVIFSVTIYLE